MASPYDKLLEMISCLDLQDDGIRMNHKIKSIVQDFCNIIKDEQMLSESMDYMNNKVLSDNESALKFALLFSSRNFDSLAMNDFKVRCKMLNILQTNYSNAEKYRKEDKNRLYNSITLLGEYYHRVRLADGNPISILGESLIGLLTQEINTENLTEDFGMEIIDIDLKLAKLILSQVTLNGDIMRTTHKNELNNLLYHIRKILIEKNNLIPSVKALLLMTLDLYYSNFTSLTEQLEAMYTKYLVEEDKINRINNDEKDPQQQQQQVKNESLIDILETDNIDIISINELLKNEDDTFNNDKNNDCYELPLPTTNKKWSEQVCEDSMFEAELLLENNCSDNTDELCYQSLPPQSSSDMLNDTSSCNLQQTISLPKSQQDNNYNKHRMSSPRNEHSTSTNNHYRSNHTNNHQPTYNNQHHYGQQNRSNNRHNNNSNNNNKNNNSYDDDRNSVRSEGGSIRLYSVGDRLRHAQNTNPSSTLHNSRNQQQGRDNWDRNYHTFDGRRRSNSRTSNYENSNNNNTNYRNNNQQNNRNNYDRPPRFSRNNIEASWRNNPTTGQQDSINNRSGSHGPDSRSSSRNRTLPRPNRHSANYENYNNNTNNSNNNNGNNNAGPQLQQPPSVSPDAGTNSNNANRNNRHYHKEGGYNNNRNNNGGHYTHHNNTNNNNNNLNQQQQQQQNRQQSRNFGRSNNNQQHYSNRYGSHNSLTSDTGTWERRGRPNNLRRNSRGKSQDWEEIRSVHSEPNEKWDEPATRPLGDNNEQRTICNDDEIAKNARNTTKYMQYLSQKQ